MKALFQDFRYGARLLLKSPAFSILAVLILSLGIGANSAVFTLFNFLLLRPLPVSEPDRLVRLYSTDREGDFGSFSYPDYLFFREGNRSFSGLIAHGLLRLGLSTGQGEPDILFGEIVSANYFLVLGVKPAAGRTFLPEEDQVPGGSPVAVVSHDLWRSRFGSDPALVGRQVRLNGVPFTVVGIAPAGFQGTLEGGVLPASVWVPAMMAGQVSGDYDLADRQRVGFEIVGRLKPGVTQAQARADLVALENQLKELRFSPEDRQVHLAEINRIMPSVQGPVIGFMALLLGVVGLVLVIACTNIANMLLVRMLERRKEIATRLSLGARRIFLVRQLVVEGVLLALVGGILGLVLASWTLDLLATADLPIPVPVHFDLSIDQRVLGFTFLVSLLTILIFGLTPALAATKLNLVSVLNNDSGTSGQVRKRFTLRKFFVITQVTLSMVLLVFAGLLVRGLQNAGHIDPGFDIEHGLVMSFDLGTQNYHSSQGQLFYREFLERVRAVPGVESASLTSRIPLSLGNSVIAFQKPGQEDWLIADFSLVDTQYFETLGIELLRGRAFSEPDRDGAPPVAVVNETAAQLFWPGEDPLGQRITLPESGAGNTEIVGVVANNNYRNLGELPLPHVFLPFQQRYRPEMVLVVRAGGDPASLIEPVRSALRSLNANLPVYEVKTVEQHVAASTLPARVAAVLLGAFGLLALVLTVLGIYGVIAHSVTQRTREIGIRMSFGAQQEDILRLVLRQGLTLVLVGTGLGLALALILTRSVSNLLYGISATDPLTFAMIFLLLIGASLCAILVPARRAIRVEPMMALRHQ